MKRILSVVISFMMLLTILPSVHAAEALEERIEYISSLGIMQGYEDGSFREDNNITRAEFASVAIRFLGQENRVGQIAYSDRFNDVTSDFWGADYIELASNLGMINGYTDGTFRPENYVTYNEAVKMLVSILGYSIEANEKGGYPEGYMSVAYSLDLIDFHISLTDDAITRGEVVHLIYNALDTELLIVDSLSSTGYTLGKGSTALDTFFNAEMKEGRVTANEYSSIYSDGIGEGRVEIDGTVYMTDIDCTSFLGETVEYILVENDGDEKVTYISPKSTSRRVKIDSDDIVDVEGIFTSNGVIRYRNASNSVKKLTFASNLTVIYNNCVLPYTESGKIDFEKDPDSYECVDTDNDGKYDLLKIKEYEDYYIRRTYDDNGDIVAVKDDNTVIRYNADNEEKYIVIYSNEKTEFSVIEKEDVISIASSINGNVNEIIVSRNKFDGTVSAKYADDDETVYTVDGEEYTASKSFVNKQKLPAIRDNGTFYLNYRNEIAYFYGSEGGDGVYGFLTDIYYEEGGSGFVYYAKILETNNTFAYYEFADKVKLDNKGSSATKKAKEVAELLDRTPTWDDIRTANTQVVKYKLNADGQINYVALASETASTDTFSIAAPNRKRYYSNSLFDQKWKITEDTVVFYIPSTNQGEEYQRYRAGTASKYFKSGSTYQVVLYDADENGEIGAVFYSLTGQAREETFSVDYASSKIMTIDKVTFTIDENDDERTVLSGIVNNNYTSVYVSEEFMEDASKAKLLKHGNVIQYQTNSSRVQAAYYDGIAEELVSAILWCDQNATAKKRLWNRTEIEQNSAKITTVFGTVVSIDSSKVTISVPDSKISETTDVFINDNQSVIKVNNNDVEMVDFYSIQPEKKIFIRLRYDKIKDVVIFDD